MEKIEKIVDIQIGYLNAMLTDKKLDISLSEKTKEFLAKEGYGPAYGARPLGRTINRYIENSLAKKFLIWRGKRKRQHMG